MGSVPNGNGNGKMGFMARSEVAHIAAIMTEKCL